MLTAEIAHLILVPFLWFNGYAMDDASVLECRDSIDLCAKELSK